MSHITTNYYSSPDPPRELVYSFSPFLLGSHTPTSMNQNGPESPGHMTESAFGASPLLAGPHETKIACALRAWEHQTLTGSCSETPQGSRPAIGLKIVNTTSVDWGFGFESSLVLLKSLFFFSKFKSLKCTVSLRLLYSWVAGDCPSV